MTSWDLYIEQDLAKIEEDQNDEKYMKITKFPDYLSQENIINELVKLKFPDDIDQSEHDNPLFGSYGVSSKSSILIKNMNLKWKILNDKFIEMNIIDLKDLTDADAITNLTVRLFSPTNIPMEFVLKINNYVVSSRKLDENNSLKFLESPNILSVLQTNFHTGNIVLRFNIGNGYEWEKPYDGIFCIEYDRIFFDTKYRNRIYQKNFVENKCINVKSMEGNIISLVRGIYGLRYSSQLLQHVDPEFAALYTLKDVPKNAVEENICKADNLTSETIEI